MLSKYLNKDLLIEINYISDDYDSIISYILDYYKSFNILVIKEQVVKNHITYDNVLTLKNINEYFYSYQYKYDYVILFTNDDIDLETGNRLKYSCTNIIHIKLFNNICERLIGMYAFDYYIMELNNCLEVYKNTLIEKIYYIADIRKKKN